MKQEGGGEDSDGALVSVVYGEGKRRWRTSEKRILMRMTYNEEK